MITLILLAALSSPQQVPARWACDDALYGDSVCDCGCGAADVDCDSANFAACTNNNCAAGNAPWEHQNDQCMSSTCGDGWKAADEACDDFNRLASGGCNADCSAVNDGFVCGEGAEGCTAANVGEGEGEGEGEGAVDDNGGGEGEATNDSGGCNAVAGAGIAPFALMAFLGRRRRRQLV